MQILGERLKELRFKWKQTQQEVASAMGITSRAYQMYEYGKNDPPLENLVKLADHFCTTTDYLLGREMDLLKDTADVGIKAVTEMATMQGELETLKDAVANLTTLIQSRNE